MGELAVKGELDISGLNLAGRLNVAKCTYAELILHHSSTFKVIFTPRVFTDDFAAALQFRLAGIPVFLSSEAARAALKTPAGARLVAAAS